MKFTYALVAAATFEQASATFGIGGDIFKYWTGMQPFHCPGKGPVICKPDQVPGYDWTNVPVGPIGGYGGCSFKGWTCKKKFGRRDMLAGRQDDGSKVIEASVGADGENDNPVISAGDDIGTFDIDSFSVESEFDARFEFHYTMADGSICKQSSPVSAQGTSIVNTQCGGAKSVKIVLPQNQGNGNAKRTFGLLKKICKIKCHKIKFWCKPPPGQTTTKTQPPPTTTVSTPPAQTTTPPGETTTPPGETTTPPGETKTTPPGETTTPPGETTTPPGETKTTPPGETTTPPGETTTPPGETTTPPGETTTPPGETTTPPGETTTPPGETTTPPGETTTPPGETTTPPGETTTPPGETKTTPPGETTTPPGETTTPPGETTTPPGQTTPPPVTVTSVITTTYDTTSTVFTTTTKTITSCGPEITSCPIKTPGGTHVVTVTVPVSTTICPVTETRVVTSTAETQKPTESQPQTTDRGVETKTQPPTPSQSLPCPESVPRCLTSWLDIVKECKNNADAECFCKNGEFTKNVFNCLYSYGGSDKNVADSISFFQGICAPYVGNNPNIATGAETITQIITVTPAPQATGEVTTIVVDTTVTEPCVTSGSTVPGSSTTRVISTQVTVPQVTFTPPPEGEKQPEPVGTGEPPVGEQPTEGNPVPQPTGGEVAPTSVAPGLPVGTGLPTVPSGNQPGIVTNNAGKVQAGVVGLVAMVLVAAL